MIAKLLNWLFDRPAYVMLVRCDQALEAQPRQRFTRSWAWLMILSLLVGVASCQVFGGPWELFGGYSRPLIIPPAMTVAFLVLWPLRRAISATAQVVGGRDSTNVATAAALTVLMFALALIAMPVQPVYDELQLPARLASLRPWLAWLRPEYDIHRVLLLAPLWGAWAMLIVGQFCKPNERTEPQVASMLRGCGAFTSAALMGLLTAVTLFYCPSREWTQWAQLTTPAATIVAAVAGGAVICRSQNGLRRNGLLCANVLVQLVFMLAYLANRYR
jgi:hypothetical protein